MHTHHAVSRLRAFADAVSAAWDTLLHLTSSYSPAKTQLRQGLLPGTLLGPWPGWDAPWEFLQPWLNHLAGADAWAPST